MGEPALVHALCASSIFLQQPDPATPRSIPWPWPMSAAMSHVVSPRYHPAAGRVAQHAVAAEMALLVSCLLHVLVRSSESLGVPSHPHPHLQGQGALKTQKNNPTDPGKI
jgi:hypothetical protein